MMLRVAFILSIWLGLLPNEARCDNFFTSLSTTAPSYLLENQDNDCEFDFPTNPFSCRILMFNYAAYDTVYAQKLRKFVSQRMPNASFKNFWNGSALQLETALADQQVALLPYPSKGDFSKLQNFGMVLRAFVRRGGMVIFTGSHDFEVLQRLGLIELDYAYFFSDPRVIRQPIDHPITAGLPSNFSLTNYAYPLDISDPEFVNLAEINGYSTAGFKPMGKGSVVYLGFEYYYDESLPTQLLINSLTWAVKNSQPDAESFVEKTATRRPKRITLRLKPEEYPQKDEFRLNIYPNPFYERADLELSLGDPTNVSIEITDELGGLVNTMIDRKTLGIGKHVLELPDLPTGIFFVKIKCGNSTEVRKIVKIKTR